MLDMARALRQVATVRAALLALLLLPAAARAFEIPLGEGNTLRIGGLVQTQGWITENGAPSAGDPAYDLFVRRTRINVGADLGPNWSGYLQIDNANFGKFGNFTGRMIVQDAFVTWAPTGRTGGNVFMVEAGIVYFPVSRSVLSSSSNQITVEGHPDLARGFTATSYPGNRTTGAQVRGWLFDKKIGFRGGLYEGVQQFNDPGLNPKHHPAAGGFVNFDLIGSEEGAILYSSVLFGKQTVLSIGAGATYQSQALRVPKGVTDQKSLNGNVYFNQPFGSGAAELILIAQAGLYGNGTGSKDTGLAFGVDASFRYGWFRPYVSFEWFDSSDCPGAPDATPAQCAQVHTADSRNLRAGLDFYFQKSANHLMLEFSLNRGQSIFGAQSITVATAGYAPPLKPGEQPLTSLGHEASKSLVACWSFLF